MSDETYYVMNAQQVAMRRARSNAVIKERNELRAAKGEYERHREQLGIAIHALREIEKACPVGGGAEAKGIGMRLSLAATHALRQISGAAPTTEAKP